MERFIAILLMSEKLFVLRSSTTENGLENIRNKLCVNS